jgi:hypothetical protein
VRRSLIVVVALGCSGREPPEAEPVPVPTPPPRVEPPQTDTATTVGDVRVIELGTKDGPLREQLKRLHATSGRHLVVETTAEWCRPCKGITKYLRDPAMTAALAGVTLARVDFDAFNGELEGVGLPSTSVPWFAILGDDLQPVDMMSSDEWGDDVPANMAPVLHAFVTGTYTNRRHPWHRP